MIISFGEKETEKIFCNILSYRFSKPLQQLAKRKLKLINSASSLLDLRIPPANHLKKLTGADNFYSIRVNAQFRIIFLWQNNHAHQVQLIDYH